MEKMIMVGKNITKRQIQALVTRQKLIDSAVKLFSMIGYNRITVEDIVHDANTSRGTFYLYFKSKENIIVEILKIGEEKYKKWYDTLDRTLPARDQLIQFSEKMNQYAESIGVDVIKILLVNQIGAHQDEKYLSGMENSLLFRIIHNIIDFGQKNEEFRADMTPGDLSRLYISMIRVVLYNWCLCDGRRDVIDMGRKYALFILTAFRKDAPALPVDALRAGVRPTGWHHPRPSHRARS